MIKKIISAVSFLGLFLSNSASADLISPGPVEGTFYFFGLGKIYDFLQEFFPQFIIFIVVISVGIFILIKIERKNRNKVKMEL